MLTQADRQAIIEDLVRARTGEGLGETSGVDAHRRSPACGDEVTVRVALDQGRVRVRWEGHGCTVSLAAASALAAAAEGVPVADVTELAERYLATLDAAAEPDPGLGDLEAFAGIGRYPLRAGCASLAWRAALDALRAEGVR